MGIISEGVDLLKLANKAQNADLYKQLGEWIDKVNELQKQNEELTAERNQLREQVRFKGVVERINGYTFAQGDDEEICPRCAEVDRRAIHLMVLRIAPGATRLACPACNIQTHRHVPVKRDQALTKQQ
jgi:hypothetical protein